MPSGKSQLPGPLSEAVASLISDAIERSPMNQATVAENSQMSASQLSRVLSKKKVFTLEELDRVCRALDLDIVTVISIADGASREARAFRLLTPREERKLGLTPKKIRQLEDELVVAGGGSHIPPSEQTPENREGERADAANRLGRRRSRKAQPEWHEVDRAEGEGGVGSSDSPIAPVIDGGFGQNAEPTDLQRAAFTEDGDDGASNFD